MSRIYFGTDRGRVAAFAVGAVVAVLVLAAGVAFAGDAGDIHACVDAKGKITIVDSEAECKSKEEFLEWNEKGPPGGDVPSDAVMFFNATSCPSGWTEFSAAGGRVLVALPSGGSLGATVGTLLTDAEDRSHDHSVNPAIFSSSSVGSHAHSVNPPPKSSTLSGSHSHVWSKLTGSTKIWEAGDSTHMFDWETGMDSAGSGFFPLIASPPAAGTTSFNTSASFTHTHTTDIGTFASGLATGHSHLVDVPDTQSSNAPTSSVIPYLQLLVCQKT